MRRFLLALTVLLAGCDLYFTDGDDECKAYPATDLEGDIAPNLLRNPDNGECEGYGGGQCDDRCGPCPVADQAVRDWGSCYSECDGKAANDCMAAPGCFAAYTEWPSQDRQGEFRGCWQTAPSGPTGGSCAGLDAQSCSRHDNCTAHYTDEDTKVRTSPRQPTTFLYCVDEVASPSCASTTCQTGSHCEEQCYPCDGQDGPCDPICQPMCVPDTNACEAIDCGAGWACTEVCSGGACGAQCVPSGTCEAITTEPACKTRPDCTTVYNGEDCTCYPDHCECNVLTYERCETK